jgi:Rieske Fe-S protein
MDAPQAGSATGRRGFLGWLLGLSATAWLASIVYPVFAYLRPPPVAEPDVASVTVATLDELPAGSSRIFKFGREPALLVRTRAGELRAFIATCTHLDCTVQYRDDWDLIWCACHNGRYDLNGRNVSGPPPRPLTTLTVEVKGDDIIVHRG